MIYDAIIIGGGPAALSASIYAARQKIKFIVVTKDIGGQVAISSDVENYLGIPGLVGSSLSGKFQEHAEKNKIIIKDSEEVKSIVKKGKNFIVKTAKSKYGTRTILIASGKKPRKLNIPGENNFYGKGISYCATCDVPLFKDREISIIGGGNSAMDAALLAEKYCKKIYLITINNDLIGEEDMKILIKKSRKIRVLKNAKATEILGDKFVTGLKVESNAVSMELKVQGVVIEIGYVPSVDFDNLTKKNKWNEIIIHEEKFMSSMTSVKGIFAAGDCTSIPEKQAVVAAGEGAKAILSIFKYLHKGMTPY